MLSEIKDTCKNNHDVLQYISEIENTDKKSRSEDKNDLIKSLLGTSTDFSLHDFLTMLSMMFEVFSVRIRRLQALLKA